MMENLRRYGFGRNMLGVLLGLALFSSGCGGGRAQTGDVVEDAPGQQEGQQASMEEMQRLMKQGTVQ